MFGDYAEVKRMYTRPAARGRGVAKALLRRIEDESRRAGKLVLRLETGTYQQEAIGLYERMGFRPRGPFGCNSSNLIRQSLLVSETEAGRGAVLTPRWDRDPPSGETEISE